MNDTNDSRRSFIKKAVTGGILAVSIPEIVSAAMVSAGGKKKMLKAGKTILFQGDSITDAGRNKDETAYNNARGMGNGYAMLAGASLLERYSSFNLKIYNKGISGNKVYQLAERWDKDCLELKPDIVSILIGVNDIWHKLNGQYDGTAEIYKRDYIALLEKTKRALPDVQLIICEPFAVPGVKAVDDKWYPEFYDYQRSAREIADLFGAIFIPYQKIFDEAQKRAPGIYWTHDGVHPSLAGAELIAEAWLSSVK